LRRVGLVDADDPVAARTTRALDGDGRAEADDVGRLGRQVDDFGARDALLELGAPLGERGQRVRAIGAVARAPRRAPRSAFSAASSSRSRARPRAVT
jgi:hypothetical protein